MMYGSGETPFMMDLYRFCEFEVERAGFARQHQIIFGCATLSGERSCRFLQNKLARRADRQGHQQC